MTHNFILQYYGHIQSVQQVKGLIVIAINLGSLCAMFVYGSANQRPDLIKANECLQNPR